MEVRQKHNGNIMPLYVTVYVSFVAVGFSLRTESRMSLLPPIDTLTKVLFLISLTSLAAVL